MKWILLPLLVAVLTGCNSPGKTKAADEQWIQLFNGENLDGWDIKIVGYEMNDNFGNTFRVEDGLMKVRYDAYDTFTNQYGHIFYKEKFSHYHLKVEYRFVGEQVPGGKEWAFKNSGVMYHSQSAASMNLNQYFPVSLNGQLFGGHAEGERPTMGIVSMGTHVHINGELVTEHLINSTSKTIRGEEWVVAEFIVHGDSIIHHLVDGDTVLTFSRPVIGGGHKPEGYPIPGGTPLNEGFISLASESHPIDFRKVELLDLTR